MYDRYYGGFYNYDNSTQVNVTAGSNDSDDRKDDNNISNFIVKKTKTFNASMGVPANLSGAPANLSGDSKGPPLPKIDGRKKDHKILELTKLNSKNECLDTKSKICSPDDVLSIVSYFVKKKTNKNKDIKDLLDESKPKTAEQNLETAKKILDCPTEACVLTHPDFVASVTKENVMSKADIKITLDEFFKPVGDISNNPQVGSYPDSMVRVVKYWELDHPEFLAFYLKDNHSPHLSTADIKDLLLERHFSTYNLIKIIELYPQYKKFGILLQNQIDNLRGGHATCLYIDMTSDSGKWTVEWFQSHGTPPEPYISEWIEKIVNALKEYRYNKHKNDNVKAVIVNNMVQQGSSIECGLYSMFYLRLRLLDTPYTWFRKNIIPASAMIQFRKMVYRNKDYDI
jgi:hypothetical protein